MHGNPPTYPSKNPAAAAAVLSYTPRIAFGRGGGGGGGGGGREVGEEMVGMDAKQAGTTTVFSTSPFLGRW